MSHKIPFPSEDIQQQIAADYRSGLWVRQIKQKYPMVGWNTIPRILAMQGVALHESNGRPLNKTRYSFDIGFFERETPEAAYWAGFIMADGSVTPIGKSTRLRLSLATKDIGHLYCFCDDLGVTRDVVWLNATRHPNGATYHTARVRLAHTSLGPQLARYGIVFRKTENFQEPQVPDALLPHYLRGWADGDGTLFRGHNYTRLKICGNQQALEWYGCALKHLGWDRSIYIYPGKSGHYAELFAEWRQKTVQLPDLLLSTHEPRLARRWEV